jgi:hypothetical protein
MMLNDDILNKYIDWPAQLKNWEQRKPFYKHITLIVPSELYCKATAKLFKELKKQESCFHGSLQWVLCIYCFSDEKPILNNKPEGCGTKRSGQIWTYITICLPDWGGTATNHQDIGLASQICTRNLINTTQGCSILTATVVILEG